MVIEIQLACFVDSETALNRFWWWPIHKVLLRAPRSVWSALVLLLSWHLYSVTNALLPQRLLLNVVFLLCGAS